MLPWKFHIHFQIFPWIARFSLSKHEDDNNNIIPDIDTFITHIKNVVSTINCHKTCIVTPLPFAHFCSLPAPKWTLVSIYCFLNCALELCSDSYILNSEISGSCYQKGLLTNLLLTMHFQSPINANVGISDSCSIVTMNWQSITKLKCLLKFRNEEHFAYICKKKKLSQQFFQN